ncbi:hypothetical protein ABEB36_007438 [Hypothenemus hampei]|uniref:Uncharacterized protein n=1 Tax=Hypothenemus hampei TaxID=57062 RepID=A0ABD1EWC4_HYPHA
MPCNRKVFNIHPFGLILLCLGCAIVALIQNKALMKGGEDQKNKKDDEGNNAANKDPVENEGD